MCVCVVKILLPFNRNPAPSGVAASCSVTAEPALGSVMASRSATALKQRFYGARRSGGVLHEHADRAEVASLHDIRECGTRATSGSRSPHP